MKHFTPFEQSFSWRTAVRIKGFGEAGTPILSAMVQLANAYEDPTWLDVGWAEDVLANQHAVHEIHLDLGWIAEALHLRLDPQKWRTTSINHVLHPIMGPAYVIATNGVEVVLTTSPFYGSEWLMASRSNILGAVTKSHFDSVDWNWVKNCPHMRFADGATGHEGAIKAPCCVCGMFVERVGEAWVDKESGFLCRDGQAHLGQTQVSNRQQRFDDARTAQGLPPKALPNTRGPRTKGSSVPGGVAAALEILRKFAASTQP